MIAGDNQLELRRIAELEGLRPEVLLIDIRACRAQPALNRSLLRNPFAMHVDRPIYRVQCCVLRTSPKS